MHNEISDYLRMIDDADNAHSPTSRAVYADALILAIRDYFTDDELIELVQAKAEGRLVILPCKVGDMVWDKYGNTWDITQIELCMNSLIWFRCGHKGTDDYTAFSSEDIGEDYFLIEQEGKSAAERWKSELDDIKCCACEAAEKALGGGEG